jgi:putative addiction module killer protein
LSFIIREFVTADGRVPFREWLGALDVAIGARIQVRVMRFETGNLGDHKSVGDGVWEARMTFGAGYRLYFGKDGNKIVVLLVGGDKSSQTKDIKSARRYWSEYLQEVDHGKTK